MAQQQQTAGRQYQDQPGFASAFKRPDAQGNQPQYTGPGLDLDGNEIEVAVWAKISKNGTPYLRIKIQPPYNDGEQQNGTEQQQQMHDPHGEPF